MYLVAFTESLANGNHRDSFEVHGSIEEAEQRYEEIRVRENTYSAALSLILDATEPQWEEDVKFRRG